MGEREETLAVVVARLDDLRQNVDGLRSDMREWGDRHVTRNEWEMWRDTVTAMHDSSRRRAEDLQKQIDGRHVPWTGVAAVVVAAAALAWSVFGPVV